MSVDVIMPVLGMAQESGKIIHWLKSSGEPVVKGEPLIEVETDKAIAELEAPADGILANISADEGDEVPVTTVIAEILAPDEVSNSAPKPTAVHLPEKKDTTEKTSTPMESERVQASPLARRVAEEHGLDLRHVQPEGNRITKTDVMAHLNTQGQASGQPHPGRLLASPKARRMMEELGINHDSVAGSGPDGAVLAADVERIAAHSFEIPAAEEASISEPSYIEQHQDDQFISTISPGLTWRIMAERTTQSWQSAPHFYLMREVNASQFIQWRDSLRSQDIGRVTYSDLLVKVVAEGLRRFPRMNASWQEGQIVLHKAINVGLAVATENGLMVSVIHQAEKKSLPELAAERERLVEQAREGRLHLEDIADGTFTLSNLGMYGVDVFTAVINPPQAVILAVGRISEQVVPLRGAPVVQPMMILSLSCDHRVIDGALGAIFLQSLAEMIEQPMRIIN